MSELIAPAVLAQIPDKLLPDPDEISYYILEKERKIYLDFVVDDYVLGIQRMILRWNMEDRGLDPAQRQPIRLYIMSYGGSMDYMWTLIDSINTSVTPVYTYNMGQAASAASLIFMSGRKRFMMPNAKVVIHEGSASFEGDAIKVKDQSDSYKKDLRRMKEYILSHSAISRAQLMKKRANDWELDAQLCLDNKVCDAIINSIEEII